MINVVLVFSGGMDYSPFSFETISSGINDTATFHLDEEIRNTSKCIRRNNWGRFPNNASEIMLRWLFLPNVEIKTNSSNDESYLYFRVCIFVRTKNKNFNMFVTIKVNLSLVFY